MFGGIFIALRVPFVQNFLIEKISNSIEKQTGSKVEIKRISLSGLSKIQLEDIFLSDSRNDTLLYVKKLRTEITGIYLSSNSFQLTHTELEEPYFKIVSYDDGSISLFTFLDALEKETSDSTNVASSSFFSITSTTIKDGRFVYVDVNKKPVAWGMNYDDLDFYGIDATIDNIRTVGDTIKMQINAINLEEKSGLKIIEGQTKFAMSSGLLTLDNAHFSSPKSSLNAKYLKFSYLPSTKAWANFTDAVALDYLIKKSKINLGEVSLFNDNLKDYDQTLTASGHIKGTVRNMRCEDIDVRVYEDTHFVGNLSMIGLPKIEETFFDAHIKEFHTSLNDIEKVKLPNYEEEYLKFPTSIKKLGVFNYQGKYTGLVSDFVFYGQFFSDYGNLKTDISVKPTTKTKQLELSGKIITEDFRIGNLLSNKMLGKVSFNVDILNAMANESHNSFAEIKGKVNRMEILNYSYENINVDGYFANKIFDGKLSMDAPDIAFKFAGNIDLHQEIPETNFNLEVTRAKLHPLNLNKITGDSLSKIAFSAQSRLNGGSIDKTTGTLKIFNLEYENSKGLLRSDSILLKSSLKDELRTIKITSNFADASFTGNFKLSELPSLPERISSQYVNLSRLIKDSLRREYGELLFEVKNINSLVYLLTDDAKISNNTTLRAGYDFKEPFFSLNFSTDFLKIKDYIFHKIRLNSEGKEALKTQFTIDRTKLSETVVVRKFSLQNTIQDNKMQTVSDWGDSIIPNHKGSFSLHSVFSETENKNIYVATTINPTNFLFDGKTWQVHEAEINVDSTAVSIKNFQISTKEQYLKANGVVSEEGDSFVNINLKDIEIGHIWNVWGYPSTKLEGKISGYAEYQNNDKLHTLQSDLQIPKLRIEKQDLGSVHIRSDWDKQKNTLNSKVVLHNDKRDFFTAEGNYSLQNSELDYTAVFNGFDLSLAESFTQEYIRNIKGTVDGALQIKGKVNSPKMEGFLNFDIPRMTVTETGVSYRFKEKLEIKNNTIGFEDFKIIDRKNNLATINGNIVIDPNTTSNVDLKIKAKHFKILENSYQPLAYGDARVSAELGITGNFSHVKIKGKVNTDNNSKIIVPFDSTSEVEDSDFITFLNPADSIFYEEDSKILFIPTNSKSSVSFDVGFSINPTSEIQVFFESKSGSILKSKGTADLQISSNANGKQNVFGEYTVSQGTFFYSIENIVNKKFILQEGGTIRWNGAPEKAYVDLRAVYPLKASLAPLLYQDTEDTKLRQTLVLCKTHISGQLEDPKLSFEIEFPNLDPTTEGNAKAALQTTDLTKQVLSLLVFNSFTTPEYTPNAKGANNNDALSVTTSELLSSQISNLLSQLSKDVNIGFIYRQGDDLTKEELGLAISTELLKNRVVISGNLGFSSQDENSRFNDFVGDVDIDIKLNKKGNLRLRAFSHAQDNLYYYENKRNTQGVGIIYNEEFDTFKELIQYYKEKLGLSKKKDKK